MNDEPKTMNPTGLNVVRIMNEPTAAAFAYGLDKKFPGPVDPSFRALSGRLEIRSTVRRHEFNEDSRPPFPRPEERPHLRSGRRHLRRDPADHRRRHLRG